MMGVLSVGSRLTYPFLLPALSSALGPCRRPITLPRHVGEQTPVGRPPPFDVPYIPSRPLTDLLLPPPLLTLDGLE